MYSYLDTNNNSTTPATFIGWFSPQTLGYIDPIQPTCLQPPSAEEWAEDLMKHVVELYQDRRCFIVHNNLNILSLPESKSVFSKKCNIHVVSLRGGFHHLNPINEIWEKIDENLKPDEVFNVCELRNRVKIQWTRLMWQNKLFVRLGRQYKMRFKKLLLNSVTY
jgi:hypothetical protein